LKLSKLSRVSGFVFGTLLLLATACATGPAMPFEPLATPIAPAEEVEQPADGELLQTAEPVATPDPTATPAPKAVDLRPQAEATYLSQMSGVVATAVREQAWFAGLTPQTMALVAAIQRCAKAAQPRGEVASVADMLRFAAEQPWYADGLDEREVKGLSAVFDAYARSHKDENAPPVGSELSTTLRWALFAPVSLPESGEVVYLASAPTQALGEKLLNIATAQAGPVEELIGKFPYSFLHFIVTSLPEEEHGLVTLGASYNEYVFLGAESVTPETITHEMTHATLYGIFPLWFEEGMAEFVESYLTASLTYTSRVFNLDLIHMDRDNRLDLRARGGYDIEAEYAERAQGFLFLRDVHATQGHEEFRATIRQLRTRSLGDADLLRALAQRGTPEVQAKLKALICERVVGVRAFTCP
jgi:hypothetical protein